MSDQITTSSPTLAKPIPGSNGSNNSNPDNGSNLSSSLDYITGVSNGDVDWLFRGKSKKLTKKMNNNPSIDTNSTINTTNSTNNSNNVATNNDSTTVPNKSSNPSSPKSNRVSSQMLKSSTIPSPNTSTTNNLTTAMNTSHSHPPITPSIQIPPPSVNKSIPTTSTSGGTPPTTSKFKLGRSRSSSASVAQPQIQKIQQQQQQQEEPKRRGSLNILSNSLTNSDLAVNNANDIPIISSSPPSATVSRNNSSQKRSLFSSFSSKFKSSSSSSPASPAISGNPSLVDSSANSSATSSANISPVVSSQVPTPSASKLSSSPLTSSIIPPINNETIINKPPAGTGIIPTPKQRKSSFSSILSSSPGDTSAISTVNGNGNIIGGQLPTTVGISAGSDSSTSTSTAGKFFGRRRSSVALPALDKKSITSTTTPSRVILNKNPNREEIPLKELNGIKLRRVTFALDKLIYDPQQQIPSRRPKKGNVIIPQDIMAPPPRLSQGISLNDGNNAAAAAAAAGNITTTSANATSQYTEKEISLAIEAQRRALHEAEKHAQEAHLTAKRLATEVLTYKGGGGGNKFNLSQSQIKEQNDNEEVDGEGDDDDEEESNEVVDASFEKFEIDKPLHVHENHFEDEEQQVSVDDLSLETIYTRCCHLREILPIPATLKQLKGKSKPLQVLKLLNPKPTLIDVLSFSDFIAITPINTVIFDNVTMTTEMLKHFLSSLVYNKSLEKLSLRNVAIDEIGWKYLCKFLSRNSTIKKLDISQQRIKSDTKSNLIRANMNWDLFIQSLILRNGIEELVINGCKLSDDTFKHLIENAVKISTHRLGIASMELNLFKSQIVANWITEKDSKCVGVDIAFNDLSQGQLQPFIHAFNKLANSTYSKLLFFSLHSTHLTNIDETAELIKSLVNVKSLRFLDLSSLPDLFPGIISKLNKIFPQFEDLRRVHFDLNDLTPHAIGAIAEIIPKMKSIFHLSLLGNRALNHSAAATLYAAVKASSTIFNLDLDYDLIDDDLSQRIAFYLMRNMDRVLKPEFNKDNKNNQDDQEEDLIFDGTLLMQTAEKLLKESDDNKKEDAKIQRIVTNAFIERTRAARKDIHKIIDTLFEKRNQGTLSFEGKESLLRFCLLDSSLEKLVHMFEERSKYSNNYHEGLTPSPSAEQIGFNLPVEAADKKPQTEEKASTTKEKESTLINPNSRKSPSILPPTAIKLSPHDTLHQSSTELITAGPILTPRHSDAFDQFLGLEQTFQPHQVVIDSSSDGKSVPIDNFTGRPILMRSISQTSTHAKEQEQEEGEFHRFGFFMQQHDDDEEVGNNVNKQQPKTEIPTLNVLPSGPELRDAIIKAKGIESVNELINKINNNYVSIDNIYKLPIDKTTVNQIIQDHKNRDTKLPIEKKLVEVQKEGIHDDDNVSIDSFEVDDGDEEDGVNGGQQVNAVVNEVYDKLLNDAQRVRSNKQD
ncbi:hypothetical protein DFJ63DRAFT_317670 [Scheffersomyces coipomensis]|uniref:uncharacterized protein n=1 Tax=Scheffersomyces coipomensis TaxID=1788519 RepID=UPI00315D593C